MHKLTMCLLAGFALATACRAPSAHERSAAAPPHQQVEVPAARDPQPDVLPVPDNDTFHRKLTVSKSSPARTISSKAIAAAVRGSNTVSFTLWRAFAEKDNFVASPYSIRAALRPVYLAANGQSRKRLQSLLLYPDVLPIDTAVRAGSEARLDFASSLWIADALYLPRVADFSRATVHAIDFSTETERARRFINTWMSQHSRGDTGEALPESTITPRSRAILVDTVSFAGAWPPRFMLAEGLHAWTDQNGRVGRVSMDMAYGGKCKAVFNDPGTAALDDCTGSACREAADAAIADYQDSSLSLMVVKPESWKKFVWNESSFLRIWSALQKAPVIDFNFPSIDLRSVRDLKQPLQRLGVAVERLVFDGMFHQASFHTDAEAEKRAPTAYEQAAYKWIYTRPQYFTVDYAFYFVVVERETGLILLMGQVVEPPPHRTHLERGEYAPHIAGAMVPQ